MNDNGKDAPTLQVLDNGGGRYTSSFASLDDGVVRFGQVMPNSPVDNLNRLTPGHQSQSQCWPPYSPYEHNARSTYDHYRPYSSFTGQFTDGANEFATNPFPMRYQEVSAKPDPLMTSNHLLCLDDGLGYPMSGERAASLPPFSSITTQSLPPRPQSAIKEVAYEEGLGARLNNANNEFGEGLTARLLERGMSLPSREGDNYTPPVQYRPWEANPGPVRVSSRSQSENSQTPPSSSGAYPTSSSSEKRDDDGAGDNGRWIGYRAKSDSSNIISLDKPNEKTSPSSSSENHHQEGATYSTLTKVPPQFPPPPPPRDEQERIAFNSFGYFTPPGLAPPPPPIGASWDYRNEMKAETATLVPPPAAQNMTAAPAAPHQFLDDRQMRRHHHHPHPYIQNGNYEGGNQSMQQPNAHNFSGGLRSLKGEMEPGLKGGEKKASEGGGGRGTKNPAGAGDEGNEKKPKKQKRKRCGECLGCQRKDNCGECAPCRNDKSHQICKMRRCEKLIERKVSGPLSSVEPQANKLECPDQSRDGWW